MLRKYNNYKNLALIKAVKDVKNKQVVMMP
jgi:hypothetical protein